jgi:hypothetical protein
MMLYALMGVPIIATPVLDERVNAGAENCADKIYVAVVEPTELVAVMV